MNGTGELPYEHTVEHWTGEESLKFLENRDTRKPFFLKMSFQRPHPNFQIAREHIERYAAEELELPESAVDAYVHKFASKPKNIREQMLERIVPEEHLKKILQHYFTLISAIDDEIGRVLEYLKEIGEYENTVIAYSADHGDFAGEHGIYRKNIGIYESIHRIPFLLKYPGNQAGIVSNEIIESIDLYPTICQACDIPIPESVEGKSLIPIAEGAKGKEFALAEWIWFGKFDRINALRTKDYRIIFYGGENGGELYHTAEDSGEIHNLWDSDEHKDKKIELLALLLENVSKYKCRTHLKDDFSKMKRSATGPTTMIHKYYKKWSDVKATCYDK